MRWRLSVRILVNASRYTRALLEQHNISVIHSRNLVQHLHWCCSYGFLRRLTCLPHCFVYIFLKRSFYFPAQLIGVFILNDLRQDVVTGASSPAPPRYMPPFLSRVGFSVQRSHCSSISIPTRTRFRLVELINRHHPNTQLRKRLIRYSRILTWRMQSVAFAAPPSAIPGPREVDAAVPGLEESY